MKYKKNDIFALVVLYNTNYKDSETVSKLMLEKEIQVIVCDNSIRDYNNAKLEKFSNFTYINMNGNKGLSKAYNMAIEGIPNNKLIVLLDDDSILPTNFFDELLHEVVDNCDIYLPLVKDKTGILSPCKEKKGSFFRYKSVSEIDDDFSAINSGMIVKSDVFNNYKYDENLFLDYIDHDFIRSMKSRNKKFKILKNICLQQNFSQNNDNKKSAIIRLGLLKKDLYYYYKDNRMKYYWIIFKKKIHLCIIHKTLVFLLR